MAPTSNEDHFKFLISCIRWSNTGRVDFGEVAKECGIVSKGAAAKRYERLLKAHGISHNPNGSGCISGMAGTGIKRGSGSNAGPAQKKRKYVEPPPGTESADEDLGTVVKEEKLEPEKSVVKTEPGVDPAVVAATVSDDTAMSIATMNDSPDGDTVSAVVERAPEISANRIFAGIIQPVPGDIWDTIEETSYIDLSPPSQPFTFRSPLPSGRNTLTPLPEDPITKNTSPVPSVPPLRRAMGTPSTSVSKLNRHSSIAACRSAAEDPYAGSIYLRSAPWQRTTPSGYNPTELNKETSFLLGEDAIPGPTPKSRLEGGSGVNARELRYSCVRDARNQVLERKTGRGIANKQNEEGPLGKQKGKVVVEIPSDDEDESARVRGSKQKPISI